MSGILDLYTHEENHGTPPFMALETESEDLSGFLVFTPKVMRWTDTVWLFDLTPCRKYWQVQAEKYEMTVMTLFQKILTVQFESLPKKTASFRAVTALNPWQAVLLLHYMKERNLKGLVNSSGSFGSTLFEQVPWSLWFDTAEQFGLHCESAGRKSFNPARFKRQREQLNRAAKRMGFAGPLGLAHVSASSINRRFGGVIGDLWKWTYPAKRKKKPPSPNDDQEPLLLEGFPWILWEMPGKPAVQRHLEYPMWQWEQLEPLLREDFDRLCKLDNWNHYERVTHLSWTIILDDLTPLPVSIYFRNPHSLHREKGTHQTALTQAQYSFFEAVQKKERDQPDEIPLISWKLVIEERIYIPVKFTDLFGEIQEHNTAKEKLLELENLLPVRIDSYVIRHDFLPEESFANRNTDKSGDYENPYQWVIGAKHRPLFIFEKPEKYSPDNQTKKFMERTQIKWWKTKPSDNLYRDYYKVTDRERRTQWVYRDVNGNWFLHGIYS